MRSIIANDLIMAMESNLINIITSQDKAMCLLDEITQEYFNQNITKENEWKLKVGYNPNSIKSEIVFDYIVRTKKELEILKKLYYQLFDELVRKGN